MSDYTLPQEADTTDEYPTRCNKCQRPIQRLSVFPGGVCLDCHAASTPPVTDALTLARMWGAK